MQRAQRLRANEDFLRVRRQGRSWAHPLVVLLVAPGAEAGTPTRVGFSASRRVGNAVTRNRARRRVREAVRLAYPEVAPGWDLVFVVRPAAAGARFDELRAAVRALLGRAALLRVVS